MSSVEEICYRLLIEQLERWVKKRPPAPPQPGPHQDRLVVRTDGPGPDAEHLASQLAALLEWQAHGTAIESADDTKSLYGPAAGAGDGFGHLGH